MTRANDPVDIDPRASLLIALGFFVINATLVARALGW